MSIDFFADLLQFKRLQAMTLRHIRNIVLTNQRKIFTAIRNTDFNIPVSYYLYMNFKTAWRSIKDTRLVDDVSITSHVLPNLDVYV